MEEPSIRRQCELLAISRTAYYYQPCPETDENLELMRRLDELHLENPVYGSRRLTVMDSTAVTLCMENDLPILVLNFWDTKALTSALRGEAVGTLVSG